MEQDVGRALVRPLRQADRDEWDELWTAYLDFYSTSLPPEVHEAQMARLLAGDEMFGLVAERDGHVVGLAHCVLHAHGWRLDRACYLQDLYVARHVRGDGIGRALIEAVYAEADRRDASYVHWLTNEGNAVARALYDQVGSLTPFIRYVRPL